MLGYTKDPIPHRRTRNSSTIQPGSIIHSLKDKKCNPQELCAELKEIYGEIEGENDTGAEEYLQRIIEQTERKPTVIIQEPDLSVLDEGQPGS